jgi:hypothetical protein
MAASISKLLQLSLLHWRLSLLRLLLRWLLLPPSLLPSLLQLGFKFDSTSLTL